MPSNNMKGENPFDRLFKDIYESIESSVKRKEALELFEKLADRVASVRDDLQKKIDDVRKIGDSSTKSVQDEIQAIERRLSQMLSDLGVSSGQSLERVMSELQSKLDEVRSQIPTLPDYTDDFSAIRSRFDAIKADTAEDVRNKLELFVEEDEKLKIDAIGYLRQELDELKKTKSEGGGNGLAFREMVTKYDLSPYLDGVTKTFNIPGTYAILSVACSSFPSVLRPTIDYTHTQSTITFTSQIEASTTLAAGQTVIIMLINA